MLKAIFYHGFCKQTINRNNMFNESKIGLNVFFNSMFIIKYFIDI